MTDNLRHAQYRTNGTQIDDPQKLVDDESEVQGDGISADAGQALTLGSDDKPFLDESLLGGGTPGGSSGQLQFNDAGALGGSLLWNGTNTVSQYNGANAQAFEVYNTRTDGSNWERFAVSWASNICTIGTAAAGTGTARDLSFSRNAVEYFRLNSALELIFAPNRRLRFQSGAWIDILENGTAVANPPANTARIFAEDDGTGKTRLMVRFGSGVAVQIAIEP